MRRLSILVVVGIILGAAVLSEAAFKLEGVGARPLALGGAFVGLADDINALYYNPAGLTGVDERRQTFMYAQKEECLRYQQMGLTTNNIGFSYIKMDTGKEIAGENYAGQEMNQSESIFGVSYGGKLIATIPEVSLGVNLKFLCLNSLRKSGVGFGLDLGGLYASHIDGLTVGVIIRNIGAEVLKEDVGVHGVVGVAYKLDHPRINLLCDLINKKDYNMNEATKWGYGLGIEYLPTLVELLTLRIGLNDGNLTGGFGLQQDKWELDYAFGSMDLMDKVNNHYVSITLRF